MLVVFGGSKDVEFNREVSDLLGPVRVKRVSWQTGRWGSRTTTGENIPILEPAEIRQLPEGRALVIAENGQPIIAQLTRCIDGKTGAKLLADKEQVRASLATARKRTIGADTRKTAALVEARRRGLTPDQEIGR